MNNIINLTPHTINFILPNGEKMEIPASGQLARVSVHTEVIGEINGIPVTTSVFGKVEGLPDPQDGVAFIVSSLVAQRCGDRKDIFIPNESVRDESGRIIGCRSLGRI